MFRHLNTSEDNPGILRFDFKKEIHKNESKNQLLGTIWFYFLGIRLNDDYKAMRIMMISDQTSVTYSVMIIGVIIFKISLNSLVNNKHVS